MTNPTGEIVLVVNGLLQLGAFIVLLTMVYSQSDLGVIKFLSEPTRDRLPADPGL